MPKSKKDETFVKGYYRRKHGRADHGGRVTSHHRKVSGREEDGWEKGKYEIHYHDNESGEHMHLKLRHPGDSKYESYVVPKEKLPDPEEKIFLKYLGKYSSQKVVGSRKKGTVASKGTFKEKDGELVLEGKNIKLVDTSYGNGSKNKLAIGLKQKNPQGKGGNLVDLARDMGLITKKQGLKDLTKKEVEILADKLTDQKEPRSAWSMFHSRARIDELKELMEHGAEHISKQHSW